MIDKRQSAIPRVDHAIAVAAALTALGLLPALATITNTPVVRIFTYSSTVSSNAGKPLSLTAEITYDRGRTNAPIMVVMHPFSDLTGQFAAYLANARRFEEAGFFVVLPAMRQREGSEGIRDNGGVEIYDIYDAIESVKQTFPGQVDSSNVSITGYSGGGGNVLSALTKFPDYFRVGAAYFGISDYGYNTNSGFYFNGAPERIRTLLEAQPGNPTPPSTSQITDRYLARASNLASKNNPFSEIHLFVNRDEKVCFPVHDTSYRDNALAAASYPGEFTNIMVHIGDRGLYQDFNGNGLNDPDEEQYWPHGQPTADQQHAGDAWYLHRLLTGQIPEPMLREAGNFFVAGFVKTKRFMLWLGDGQNAAGDLAYSLAASKKHFEFRLRSLNPVTGRLSVDTSDMAGRTVVVRLNGTLVESFLGGKTHIFQNLRDGDVIELTTTTLKDGASN